MHQAIKNRIFGLDLLRAIAIVLVVLHHTKNLFASDNLYKYLHFLLIDGVMIFFVLSGFLIGQILIKDTKDEINFKIIKNFWKRRWLRTLPAYFFVLFIIASIYGYSQGFSVFYAMRYNFIFCTNLIAGTVTYFREGWSLAVEEWFYLLTPLLFLLLFKLTNFSKKNQLLLGIFIVLIGTIFYRYVRVSQLTIINSEDIDQNIRKQVFTTLDCIMYGVMAAWFYVYFPKHWHTYRYLYAACGLLLIPIIIIGFKNNYFGSTGHYASVFYFSIFSFAIAILLPSLSNWIECNNLLGAAITHISKISYSIYLLHLTIIKEHICLPIIQYFHLQLPNIFVYISYVLLTIALSTAMYYCIERPFMQLRES